VVGPLIFCTLCQQIVVPPLVMLAAGAFAQHLQDAHVSDEDGTCRPGNLVAMPGPVRRG
jgi:hypothetical protein